MPFSGKERRVGGEAFRSRAFAFAPGWRTVKNKDPFVRIEREREEENCDLFRKGWGVGRGGKVFGREGKGGGGATGVKSHAGEEWAEKDRVSWRRVSANNDKDERGATSSRFAKMKTETGLSESTG